MFLHFSFEKNNKEVRKQVIYSLVLAQRPFSDKSEKKRDWTFQLHSTGKQDKMDGPCSPAQESYWTGCPRCGQLSLENAQLQRELDEERRKRKEGIYTPSNIVRMAGWCLITHSGLVADWISGLMSSAWAAVRLTECCSLLPQKAPSNIPTSTQEARHRERERATRTKFHRERHWERERGRLREKVSESDRLERGRWGQHQDRVRGSSWRVRQ